MSTRNQTRLWRVVEALLFIWVFIYTVEGRQFALYFTQLPWSLKIFTGIILSLLYTLGLPIILMLHTFVANILADHTKTVYKQLTGRAGGATIEYDIHLFREYEDEPPIQYSKMPERMKQTINLKTPK